MNLESTLEDLEAQGYFASQIRSKKTITPATSALVRISFVTQVADSYLTSPILGRNFIGGFLANLSSPAWHAINLKTISHIENLAGQRLLETNASLMEILEQHLLHVPVNVHLQQIRVTGSAFAIQGTCICFETDDFKLLVLPESSICELVVENLSAHFKL
jgi:hypothetical protein